MPAYSFSLLLLGIFLPLSMLSQSPGAIFLHHAWEGKLSVEQPKFTPPYVLASPQEVLTAETRIGITQKPESEIHAALHPGDSSQQLVGVMRYDPFAPNEPLSFTLYRSLDFGQSWLESSFQGKPPGNLPLAGGGDPLVAIDLSGQFHFVRLLLTFNGATQQGKVGLYYASSQDQGLSWQDRSSPVVAGNLGFDVANNQVVATDRFIDKPWLALDRTQGPFRDQLYLVYLDAQVQPDTVFSIRCVSKSRNQNQFNSQPVTVNSFPAVDVHFASAAVGPDGSLHVSFYASLDGQQYALYHTRSTDGGNSFLPETKIADLVFPVADSTGAFPPSDIVGVERLYPCPQIAVDPGPGPLQGNLYAVWTAKGVQTQQSDGYDIYLAKSKDQGATWSMPIVVNSDPDPKRHQFYPSLAVSPRSVVLVSWYDRRADPGNLHTHYYVAASFDEGKSFPTQLAVSGSETDFSTVGDKNQGFGIGEYTQLLATSRYAIPFWADGRTGDGRLKVYTTQFELMEPQITGIQGQLALSSTESKLSWRYKPEGLIINWFQSDAAPVKAQLSDLQGKLLYAWELGKIGIGNQEHLLQAAGIAPGMYFLEFSNPKKRTIRILKRTL